MKSACGINYHNIAISCLCSVKRVIYNSTGVTALSVLYNLNTCSVSPYLQLVNSSRTESISRRNNYLFALLLELVAELADSCSFTCTINTDNHNYSR